MLFFNATLRIISAFPTSAKNLMSGSTPRCLVKSEKQPIRFSEGAGWAHPAESTGQRGQAAWEMSLKVCVKHDQRRPFTERTRDFKLRKTSTFDSFSYLNWVSKLLRRTWI